MPVAGPVRLCHIASLMRRGESKDVPQNVLQEFLESLSEANTPPNRRQQKILESYAELQFRINGGGHCSVCHASVRHVLPVQVEHRDGSVKKFECLCTRCLEAERVLSKRVTLTVGKAVVVYTPGKSEPRTQKFRPGKV